MYAHMRGFPAARRRQANPVLWPWLAGAAAVGAGAYLCREHDVNVSSGKVMGVPAKKTLHYKGCFESNPWEASVVIGQGDLVFVERTKSFKRRKDAEAWLNAGGPEEEARTENPSPCGKCPKGQICCAGNRTCVDSVAYCPEFTSKRPASASRRRPRRGNRLRLEDVLQAFKGPQTPTRHRRRRKSNPCGCMKRK